MLFLSSFRTHVRVLMVHFCETHPYPHPTTCLAAEASRGECAPKNKISAASRRQCMWTAGSRLPLKDLRKVVFPTLASLRTPTHGFDDSDSLTPLRATHFASQGAQGVTILSYTLIHGAHMLSPFFAFPKKNFNFGISDYLHCHPLPYSPSITEHYCRCRK
jgi:hypothetical protein